MGIYIQLKRSSTENNVNSHHLNQAELSKLCTLQKHSTLHYIKHCQHVLWMSVLQHSAASTFYECQFHITVLSAHSVNVSFTLQCCQHILWTSVLHYSAVSPFSECQFCITVLSACSVNVNSCCIFYKMALHHREQNCLSIKNKSTAIHSPARLYCCTLKAWNPHLRTKKPKRERGSLVIHMLSKGGSLHQTKQTRPEPLCVKTALRVKQSGLKVKQGGSWVKDCYAGKRRKRLSIN